MAKLAFPLFFLLLWLFSVPSETQGQWQSPAEQKAFNSYPLDNLYTSAPVSELFAYKPKVPDPYEVNPLFRSRPESTASESVTTDGYVLAKNGTLADRTGGYYETTGKPEELPEEDSEEESEEKTKHKENGEKPSESDGDEEDSEAGGEKEEETSQEESGGGGGDGGGGGGGEGGEGGPTATKTADKDTKNSGLDFINLIGSDFQPGRLVNIFFGIILLMFMMVAQGYMMWVFGIAYLPGTRRSLDDWKVNTEVLDRAMELLIDAFEYWNEAKLKQVETTRRRR